MCKFDHIPGCYLNFRIMGTIAGGTANFSQEEMKTVLFKYTVAWGKIWVLLLHLIFQVSAVSNCATARQLSVETLLVGDDRRQILRVVDQLRIESNFPKSKETTENTKQSLEPQPCISNVQFFSVKKKKKLVFFSCLKGLSQSKTFFDFDKAQIIKFFFY